MEEACRQQTRAQRQSTPERGLGRLPIPVVPEAEQSRGRVALGQLGVDLQGAPGRLAGPREAVEWPRVAGHREDGVDVRRARPGEGKGGSALERAVI